MILQMFATELVAELGVFLPGALCHCPQFLQFAGSRMGCFT
jgi:hypothetical protein